MLLDVKFSPPYLRPNRVDRARLLQQLNVSPNIRLVLVSAPAGYGKTTLLAEWRLGLIEQGALAAWILLDEHDNDPARFLLALCTALQKALAAQPLGTETARRELELLAGSGSRDADATLKLLSGLLAGLQVPLVIVLDDYHTVSHPGVHQVVAFLIDHLPANSKLALGTRTDPPLPLARLRARGELVEVRLSDLRFTTPETEFFLGQTLGVPLHPADLQLIEQRTEGWAVGLQLLGLSLRNWPDWTKKLLQPGESHRDVSIYLAEEVFHQLSPEIQQFLLDTSILDTLSAPLCEALRDPPAAAQAERPPAAEILVWLEQENLFVIPLDPFSRCFRYHPLFAEFLRLTRDSRDPARASQLHFRASQWYWADGQGEPAVRHALLAKQEPWLVYLLEQTGIFLVARSQLALLDEWLSALSEPALRGSPLLLIARAWARVLQGRLEQAELDLGCAEALLQDVPADYCLTISGYLLSKAAMSGHITTLRAYAARIRWDWERGFALSEQALQELPPDEQLVRCTLVFNLAIAYKERHQVEQACKYFAQAAQIGKRSGNAYIQLLSLAFLGQMAVLQGQMQEAEAFYRQALQLGYREDGGVAVPAVGYAEAWSGDWYLVQRQFDQARPRLERAARLAELCGEYGIQHVSYLAMTRLCLAENKVAEALTWFEKADRIPMDGISADKEWLDAHHGALLLAQGRLQEAVQWADDLPLCIEPSQLTRSIEEVFLVKLRARLAGAQHQRLEPDRAAGSLQIIAALQSAAEAEGRLARLVEILLLKAGFLLQAGRRSEAQACLAQAHQLADPRGWLQVFYTIPVEIPAPPGPVGSSPQLLTDREIEMMRLTAAGLTNQEIAARLYITVGTVKSHLNHIFVKLAARHRAEAIARARELGLI